MDLNIWPSLRAKWHDLESAKKFLLKRRRALVGAAKTLTLKLKRDGRWWRHKGLTKDEAGMMTPHLPVPFVVGEYDSDNLALSLEVAAAIYSKQCHQGYQSGSHNTHVSESSNMAGSARLQGIAL